MHKQERSYLFVLDPKHLYPQHIASIKDTAFLTENAETKQDSETTVIYNRIFIPPTGNHQSTLTPCGVALQAAGINDESTKTSIRRIVLDDQYGTISNNTRTICVKTTTEIFRTVLK